MIIVETRRSKGTHKADITTLSTAEVKELLAFYDSSSFVAVKNYKTKCTDIKFDRNGERGIIKYSLKSSLTEEDLVKLGFSKTSVGNYALNKEGCSTNPLYDIEVKEPVQKIGSKRKKDKVAKSDKKTKAEESTNTTEEKTETTKEEKAEVKKTKAAPLPPKKSKTLITK